MSSALAAPIPQTKLCRGPRHDEPVALPLTDEFWYFRKTGPYAGRPLSRCRPCVQEKKLKNAERPIGRVPYSQLKKLTEEFVDRCGTYHYAAKLSGVSEAAIRSIHRGKRTYVQKRTAGLILDALYLKRKMDRKQGETPERLKQSIRRQAILEDRLERLVGY